MAAKAITFAEALEFGKDYAKQVIKNAKALGEYLNGFGFKVLQFWLLNMGIFLCKIEKPYLSNLTVMQAYNKPFKSDC